MNKLLVICGPTATGKTDLALQLAAKYKTDILVADSRQVFRGMDIITGKDIPEGSVYSVKDGYWETPKGVKIWLTDLVGPNQEISVATWNRQAVKVIDNMHLENKLPILVGGTGLYIKSLLSNIESLDIPPNKELRDSLKDKDVQELYAILGKVDGLRAASMNNSDRNNPRRLVRAIEIGLNKDVKVKKEVSLLDTLEIGLFAEKSFLDTRIKRRVDERIKQGALEEISLLLKSGIPWSAQAFDTLGYKQLGSFLREEDNVENAIEKWKTGECQYAARQMTWFKKDKNIKWFDISISDYNQKVEKEVNTWYNSL